MLSKFMLFNLMSYQGHGKYSKKINKHACFHSILQKIDIYIYIYISLLMMNKTIQNPTKLCIIVGELRDEKFFLDKEVCINKINKICDHGYFLSEILGIAMILLLFQNMMIKFLLQLSFPSL